MSQSVWISGLGVNSSIGMNVAENLDSLRQGKSGVGYPEFLHTLHKQDLPVCEIKLSNEELARRCTMPLDLPRTVYLSAIAAQEALSEAGIDPKASEFRIGFISANTLGGMDTSEFFYDDFLKDKTSGHLRQVVHHECGSVTELVAKHLGIDDYVTTLSTACSSSANAIIQGSRLIKHGKLDIVLAGGADALCRFTLNGFNTLMILDSEPCKPFDEHRKGLNLGEGAGYVVLISDQVKEKLNSKVYAKVSGYANANDAFHQTASSPEGNGNYYAMSQALAMSGLAKEDIHYINAHGTGTSNNDSSEGIAIERLFEQSIPAVSSTKANTGHTLGACGGIEAVYCCLAMQHQLIYPSLRVTTPIESLSFTPVLSLQQDVEVIHTMSNSFGFGGNCTSLIFSKAN
jgi:3-oxoacyl-(acyl-carrier-protein) synthase